MKRRTLDIAFAVGGIVFSVLLLVVGLILTNQKNFATDYVAKSLDEQGIVFKPAAKLASEADFQAALLKSFGSQAKVDAFIKERGLTSEANSKCLNQYGGKPMLTGKQAECYAQDFIRLHAAESSIVSGTGLKLADGTPVDGVSYTYSTISGPITAAKLEVTKATEAGKSPEEIAPLQKTADSLQSLRVDTLLRADTLRGLLLTTYGFSVFGERAGQAAFVCYAAAAVLLLLSIFGLIHAFTSKKAEDVILVAEHHEPAKA
ncbi:MAG: hypothetical protein WCI22_03110 [Actinomycetota bacterium]